MEPCDILYTQAEYALEALRAARAKVKVVHRDSTHILINQRMFEAENKRLGIGWKVRSQEQIRRAVQEYQIANYIVVLSNVVKEGFISEGIPAEKMKAITPGIDTNRFRPGSRPDDGVFRVRCAGTLGPRKGIVYLLQAWKKLQLKRAELVFTGHKRVVTNRWVLDQVFQRYGSSDIRVLPCLGKPSHELLYHRCDLHVLPSLEEGLATVALEAMASGLPQVVTRETGVTDIWAEECGKIVPTRNHDALADAILYYYNNRDAGKQHGQVARRLVEKYTWTRFGDEAVSFVKGLV